MKKMIAEYIRTVLEIDDQETINEFINDYLGLMAETLPQMRTAYANQDLHELRTLAHTLKGSSANIGAEPIRRVSLQLQETADANDIRKCDSLISELENFQAEYFS